MLVAPPGSIVDLETPEVVLGSMYGDFGFRIPVDLEQGKADVEGMTTEFQLGNGKMVHRGGFQNTRIAAIITVHEWQVLNLAVRKFLNTDDGRTRKERYRDSVQHSASTRKRDTGQASSSGSGFIARLLFVDFAPKRVQKGHQTVSLLHPRMEGEI